MIVILYLGFIPGLKGVWNASRRTLAADIHSVIPKGLYKSPSSNELICRWDMSNLPYEKRQKFNFKHAKYNSWDFNLSNELMSQWRSWTLQTNFLHFLLHCITWCTPHSSNYNMRTLNQTPLYWQMFTLDSPNSFAEHLHRSLGN